MNKFNKLYESLMSEGKPAISPSLLKQMMSKERDASFFAVKKDGSEYHNPLGKLKTKASINKLYNYLRKGMEIDILYIFDKKGEVVNVIKKVDNPKAGYAKAVLLNPNETDLSDAPRYTPKSLDESLMSEGKLTKASDKVEREFLKLFKDVYTMTNSGTTEYHLRNPKKADKLYGRNLEVYKGRDGKYSIYGWDESDMGESEVIKAVNYILKGLTESYKPVKGMKVVYVDKARENNQRHFTLGREYKISGISKQGIEVKGDDGSFHWWDASSFEPK